MVPNMAGFNEVENLMTSFQDFDAFLFYGCSTPYPNRYAVPNLERKFKAILDDKSVTSGIVKGQLIRKRKNIIQITYIFEYISSRLIQRFQT